MELELLAYCCDARKLLAFKGLKHGAPTGGYGAYLVGVTHLGNGCN